MNKVKKFGLNKSGSVDKLRDFSSRTLRTNMAFLPKDRDSISGRSTRLFSP
jgi:hypothetical protein